MTASLDYETRRFPARMAELGFAVRLPHDWIVHELPPEEPDFSNPALFAPLAVVTAPHSAIVFAFAARPRFDDGTLNDWAHYLLAQNGLQPRAIGEHRVGAHEALVGEAVQASELGPIIVRFAFLEDGGRLVNITLSAPELLAGVVTEAWFAALESFELETPRGATAALYPAVELPPAAAQKPEQGMPRELPQDDTMEDANTWASHALAADAATLDPEHPVNASLRDRGAGLVPRVLEANDEERRARIGAGALVATIDVPYGWHVIDDGSRLLMLDPGGAVQIHLHRFALEGRSSEQVLDEIEAEARESYPDPQFVRVQDERLTALAVHNIHDGGEEIQQFHLLAACPDGQTVLRARVTTTPERAVQSGNLAELVLHSADFGGTVTVRAAAAPEAEDAGQPEWWVRARALEREGRLQEAEQAILKAADHIGASASVAQLYAQRMTRLLQAGDRAGAQQAYEQAASWITWYASQATSGGEGAALSLERDRFRAELDRLYGARSTAQPRGRI